MKSKKNYKFLLIFCLLFVVPLISATCPEVVEDCSQDQVKDLSYSQLEELNGRQIENILKMYPYSMGDNENIFKLIDERAKKDISILNDYETTKKSWFQKQGIEYSEVEVKAYKDGVVTVEGEKYKTLFNIKDSNLKNLNPMLTEDGNLILGYKADLWPGSGVKPGDIMVHSEGVKGPDSTFRFNSETKKYESINYPDTYNPMTAEEFEAYKEGKESETYGESAKSMSVFGEVNINKDGSINVKGGAEKYGRGYREIDRNNKKGLTIKFEEDGVLISKCHFAELDESIEPNKLYMTDYNTLEGGVKILGKNKNLLLKGTALSTKVFIGKETVGEELIAASVRQDTEYILGNGEPSTETYIKLSGEELSVSMNEIRKGGEIENEMLIRVSDPNIKRKIENKGDGRIYVIEKDGRSMKVYKKDKITSSGVLNTGDTSFLSSNGHEYKLNSDGSFEICTDCKEVGKALDRLNKHLEERTRNILGKKLKISADTIITEAYYTKDNIEVFRTNEGETFIIDLDSNLVLYKEKEEGEFRFIKVGLDGTPEYLSRKIGPITTKLIQDESEAVKKETIPRGAYTITPKVNLKMKGRMISPLERRNAGDILIKDPYVKGIGSDLFRLNSNTGNYEIVTSSWPGSISDSERSMTPEDFDRYRKGKYEEVIPFKYGNGVMTKNGGFDWDITDSRGTKVGRIASSGWPATDESVHLYDRTGEEIRNYKTVIEAKKAFEGRELEKIYQKKSLELRASDFFEDKKDIIKMNN